MLHYFIRYVYLGLLMGCLMGVWGCAGMMDVMPSPPGVLAPVQLNGPYDADIPVLETNQIKSASVMQDWAVPYIFMRVGTHFEKAGDSIRSIHFFNRARDEFQKRGNALGEASAVSSKISALVHFGNYRAAYLVIEALDKKWSRAPFKAFVLFNYGYYHLKNGNYARARKYFEQALAANETESKDPDLLVLRRDSELGYAITLIVADSFPAVAGRLCLADFDSDFYRDIRRKASEGLSRLNRVSVLNETLRSTKVYRYFPEISSSNIECDVLNYRGLALGYMGKTADAFQNIEQAMIIARNTNYPLGEADGTFFLNQVHLLNANHPEGIKAANALAEIASRYRMMTYAIWAHMMMAHHQKAMGDVDGVMISLDRALALMEENGAWLLKDKDFRGIGHFKRQEIYETLVEFAASKGDERKAFQTAERSKAAALVERLSGDVTGKTPDATEHIKQIHFYREQLAEYYQGLLSPFNEDKVFRNLIAKIDKAQNAYQQLNRRIKERDEALYALIGVVPPTVDGLQRILDRNTTIFSFYVGREHLYIWAISQNGFRQEKIGLSRRAAEQLVSSYLSAMGSGDKSLSDVRAEQIYDTFLKPVIPFVSGDRVGIVPHGVLGLVPFASMRYIKSYLVDGFTVFYLPHAGLVREQPVDKPVLKEMTAIIIADAPCVYKRQSFPSAEDEVNAVKKIFPRAEYVVKDIALGDDWRMHAGNYDAIHLIADHCSMEDTAADYSPSLRAARWQSGCPNTRDIFRLGLRGRATVLSICREEKISASRGEGRSAWTAAWLYAVSPQVVTQLWEVENKAKTVLTGMFYSHFKKSGDAAEALREAQNGMIRLRYGASDWAAFILTGQTASAK